MYSRRALAGYFFDVKWTLTSKEKRCLFVIANLLFLSTASFSQQSGRLSVIGIVPDAGDPYIYQLQAGAFSDAHNAQSAFERLKRASLNPVFEQYGPLTRVVINDIKAYDVPYYLSRIESAGFIEVIIRVDPAYESFFKQLEEAQLAAAMAEAAITAVPETAVVEIPEPVIAAVPEVVAAVPEVVAAVPEVVAAVPEPAVAAVPEPVVAAVPEPAVVATPEPVAAAVPEPAVAAVPEPVVSAVPEPAVAAAPEPVAAAAPEPVAAAVPEPAVAAVPEPAVAAAPEPVTTAPAVQSPVEQGTGNSDTTNIFIIIAPPAAPVTTQPESSPQTVVTVEETKTADETEETREKRLGIGLGPEANMNSGSNFGLGAAVFVDFNFSDYWATGLAVKGSHDFSSAWVFEGGVFLRRYIPGDPTQGKGKHSGFFLQTDMGVHLIIEDNVFMNEGDSLLRFMAGVRAGFRFLPGSGSFYIDPFIRAGYPFLWGAGLVGGIRF